MAKLSAHGHEVARLVTLRTQEPSEHDIKLYGADAFPEGKRYEYHYSFRSDGHILRRMVGLDVHPHETERRYRSNDFGWKLWRKLREPKRATNARLRNMAASMANAAREGGRAAPLQRASTSRLLKLTASV